MAVRVFFHYIIPRQGELLSLLVPATPQHGDTVLQFYDNLPVHH